MSSLNAASRLAAVLSPCLLLVPSDVVAAPSVQQALEFAPIQDHVEFDRPAAADIKGCTIKAEKERDQTSWVVRDAVGQILRRFSDTNADNVVDQWCYFKNGLEVYRDIDTNHNGKPDQYRWFHTAGSRWGLDRNENGKIDAWKQISVEEVAAEVFEALRARDMDRFAALLLTSGELKDLKLGPEQAKSLAAKVQSARADFQKLARTQRVAKSKSTFISFAGTKPGVVPAGTRGLKQDLLVYENVAAMIQNGSRTDQVLLGTVIQVENAWRLVDAPEISSDDRMASLGYFFNPPTAAGHDRQSPDSSGPSKEVQELMAKLEQLDQQSGKGSSGQQSKINQQRADILEKLADEASDPNVRAQWIRQLADTVSVAVQSGGYDKGVDRLKALEKKLAQQEKDKELLAYVVFRRMTADYNQQLQSPEANFVKVQAQWIEDLEAFVEKHPNNADTAEALLQLAIAQEFSGKDEEAIKWYGRIVKDFPDSIPAQKASGAKRRLESVGKRFSLRGRSLRGQVVDIAKYRGKTVLVQYWATWCEPCKADMAQIRELLSKYGKQGFEVIGVSLDSKREDVVRFLRDHRLPWRQIFESGGLESRLANEMGILTLPTMVLVDQRGNVVNRGIHVTELDAELKKILR